MLAAVLADDAGQAAGRAVSDAAELSAAFAGCIEQLGLAPRQRRSCRAYRPNWSPRPSQPWRRHAAWLVPTALLLLAVALVLASYGTAKQSQPAFPELQIPRQSTPADDGRARIASRRTTAKSEPLQPHA